MTKEFNVVIERDSDGYFVASVPSLRGCHTQAKSLDELMERIQEATRLTSQLALRGADAIHLAAATMFQNIDRIRLGDFGFIGDSMANRVMPWNPTFISVCAIAQNSASLLESQPKNWSCPPPHVGPGA